jgi:hypothetical protein
MHSKLLFCLLLLVESFHVGKGLLFGSSSASHALNMSARIGARQRMLNSHKRMPQYMIQLYKELTTGDNGGIVKKRMPYSANAIRGLNSGTEFSPNCSYSTKLVFRKLNRLNSHYIVPSAISSWNSHFVKERFINHLLYPVLLQKEIFTKLNFLIQCKLYSVQCKLVQTRCRSVKL